MHGFKTAAKYGFFPHRLGFCGPHDKRKTEIITKYLSGLKVSPDKLRPIFREFEGAFFYYELISKFNRIKDPFDRRVIEAYWIGNKLLEKVPTKALQNMIANKFSSPGLLSKKEAIKRAKSVPAGCLSHHSTHVLVVGSVTSRIKLEGRIVDFCRVGWGKVLEVRGDKVKISYQPLKKRNGRFYVARPVSRIFSWDKRVLKRIKVSDIASTHWENVIETLSRKKFENLKKYTELNIRSINRRFSSGRIFS